MKDIKDICLLTQARLGSVRVPRKMLRPFAGTTLMDIAVDKMLSSKVIPPEQCYISVHEPELVELGEKKGINVFHRSEASANSEGASLTEIYEWHDKLPYKYVVLINGCCTLFKTETMDAFIKAFAESDFEGMFGVHLKKNYYWKMEEEKNGAYTGTSIVEWPKDLEVMNTKAIGPTLEAAHIFYASRMDGIPKNRWMGKLNGFDPQLGFYPVPERETLDIDYEWQFEMCEILYKNGF